MAKDNDLDLDLFDDSEETFENAPEVEETPEELETPVDPVQSRLDRVEQSQQEQSLLTQLLADPDIRRVIEAKRTGKPVVVGDAPVDAPPAEIDYSTAPPDQIAKHLRDTVKAEVKQMISEMMAPVQQEVGQVRNALESQIRDNVTREVDVMRQRFPDFKQYEPVMHQLAGRNPDLSLEELYLLSKRRSSKGQAPTRRIESERPTPSPRRPIAQDPNRKEIGNTSADFLRLVDSVLNRDE